MYLIYHVIENVLTFFSYSTNYKNAQLVMYSVCYRIWTPIHDIAIICELPLSQKNCHRLLKNLVNAQLLECCMRKLIQGLLFFVLADLYELQGLKLQVQQDNHHTISRPFGPSRPSWPPGVIPKTPVCLSKMLKRLMFSPFKLPSTIRPGVVANYKWSDGVAFDRGTAS